MDFRITESQRRIRDAAASFAREHLYPGAAAFEQAQAIPPEIFRELGEHGLMAVGVALARGGTGAGTVAYSLAMTEIARGCPATAVTMAVTNMVGEVIEAFGTDAQSAVWCPRLAAGELGAFALSEVDAGSDPGAMRTVARDDGDHWVLDGTKQWISHGDTACVLVVWARTGGDGPRGLSCFLVPGDAPGLSVTSHEDKMGLRASHTCALALEGVRVPKDALLGSLGGGFRIAMMALDGGRIGIASQALGIGEAAWEAAHGHARGLARVAQGAQFRLADMRTRLDAARLLTLRAAHLKESKQPFSSEASMAKVFATEGACAVCQEAGRVVGPEAMRAGHRIERAVRDVRVTMIYEGTSEIQRLVIGRGLTR